MADLRNEPATQVSEQLAAIKVASDDDVSDAAKQPARESAVEGASSSEVADAGSQYTTDSEAKDAAAHETTAEGHKATRSIIVAVDGSGQSNAAVKWAAQHLIQSEDTVYLLHAQPLPIILGGTYGPTAAGAAYNLPTSYLDAEEIYQRAKSTAIIEAAKNICTDHDIVAKGIVRVGDAREVILATLEDMHADLLVVGSHGHGALKRALLGSVSDYCVHHAKCPVVVVPKTD